MAEDPRRREDEFSALRLGLDLGLALIDTAEMYGDGDAEELVGEVIRGRRRDDVFLVSKVLPSHAGADATIRACEGSLRRLETDRLDLYLLHWRGATPLDETLDGFATLVDQGKIRHWGVSNFDWADMDELVGRAGGEAVATDQVLYNLGRRGIEWDLLPWCGDRRLPMWRTRRSSRAACSSIPRCGRWPRPTTPRRVKSRYLHDTLAPVRRRQSVMG